MFDTAEDVEAKIPRLVATGEIDQAIEVGLGAGLTEQFMREVVVVQLQAETASKREAATEKVASSCTYGTT
jgi:hypothetical protein